MNFQQLKKIAEKYITEESTEFPADAFKLAKQLNLSVKNSIECKQDFKDKYPLYNCNAAYTLVNGEYTIYHDEKYAYKNFSVAHEIAHHLLEHCSDGVREHHDANLLAAILLLSPENIVKNKIKSEVELSLKCLIPYNVACEYWTEINNIVKPSNISIIHKSVFIAMLIIVLSTAIGFIGFLNKNNNTQNNVRNQENFISTPVTTEILESTSLSSDSTTSTFVTVHGEKYHKSDCRYIENKDNLIELTVETAENAGYDPCKICF